MVLSITELAALLTGRLGFHDQIRRLERHGSCSEDVQAAVSDGGVSGIGTKTAVTGMGSSVSR
jgi:hypothetical protein